MPQLGSEKNPIRFNVKDKRKIRAAYMRNEDRKNTKITMIVFLEIQIIL